MEGRMKTPPQCRGQLQSLDELLTVVECSQWLRMEEETLLENVRAGRIPVVRINRRVLRFHPRSILLSLGVPREALVPSANQIAK
jgi:hypothetical protein